MRRITPNKEYEKRLLQCEADQDQSEILQYSKSKRNAEPHCAVAKNESQIFKHYGKMLDRKNFCGIESSSCLSFQELLFMKPKVKPSVQKIMREKFLIDRSARTFSRVNNELFCNEARCHRVLKFLKMRDSFLNRNFSFKTSNHCFHLQTDKKLSCPDVIGKSIKEDKLKDGIANGHDPTQGVCTAKSHETKVRKIIIMNTNETISLGDTYTRTSDPLSRAKVLNHTPVSKTEVMLPNGNDVTQAVLLIDQAETNLQWAVNNNKSNPNSNVCVTDNCSAVDKDCDTRTNFVKPNQVKYEQSEYERSRVYDDLEIEFENYLLAFRESRFKRVWESFKKIFYCW